MAKSLAHTLVDALSQASQTISFCESLTAGLACATFAELPGVSAVLRGGLITYATDLKQSLAQVPEEIISHYGVVSAECAEAMACGVKKLCASDWGCSLTGVAGPELQEGKPVGQVWIGIAGPDEVYSVEAFDEETKRSLAAAGRNEIRQAAVRRCFEIIELSLKLK